MGKWHEEEGRKSNIMKAKEGIWWERGYIRREERGLGYRERET
jgi:hypothetical protein